MKHAVIENGIIVNTVLAEPDFAQQMGWVAFPDYVEEKAVAIGWGYDGTNWIAPPEPINEAPIPELTIGVERI